MVKVCGDIYARTSWNLLSKTHPNPPCPVGPCMDTACLACTFPSQDAPWAAVDDLQRACHQEFRNCQNVPWSAMFKVGFLWSSCSVPLCLFSFTLHLAVFISFSTKSTENPGTKFQSIPACHEQSWTCWGLEKDGSPTCLSTSWVRPCLVYLRWWDGARLLICTDLFGKRSRKILVFFAILCCISLAAHYDGYVICDMYSIHFIIVEVLRKSELLVASHRTLPWWGASEWCAKSSAFFLKLVAAKTLVGWVNWLYLCYLILHSFKSSTGILITWRVTSHFD